MREISILHVDAVYEVAGHESIDPHDDEISHHDCGQCLETYNVENNDEEDSRKENI